MLPEGAEYLYTHSGMEIGHSFDSKFLSYGEFLFTHGEAPSGDAADECHGDEYIDGVRMMR